MRLKPFDFLVLALAIGSTAYVSFAAYGTSDGRVNVIASGKDGEWVYALVENRSIAIAGPLGSTIVEIHDGHVHFVSSPCPNQTCVASGSVSRAGQWLACLPNEVFIRLEGSTDDGRVDAEAF